MARAQVDFTLDLRFVWQERIVHRLIVCVLFPSLTLVLLSACTLPLWKVRVETGSAAVGRSRS